MSSEIRTFKIRDAAGKQPVTLLPGDQLAAVQKERGLTSAADLPPEQRPGYMQKAQAAAAHNIEREAVMPSSAVQEIARYAPTTEIELTVVGSALGIDTSVFGAAIVQVVRQTLEELTS